MCALTSLVLGSVLPGGADLLLDLLLEKVLLLHQHLLRLPQLLDPGHKQRGIKATWFLIIGGATPPHQQQVRGTINLRLPGRDGLLILLEPEDLPEHAHGKFLQLGFYTNLRMWNGCSTSTLNSWIPLVRDVTSHGISSFKN